MANWTEESLSDRQRQWLEVIRVCEASGKTMKEYAESEGVSLQSLYAWKKTFVKKGILPRTRDSGFQRIEIVKNKPAAIECRLLLPNGITVVLTGDLAGSELTQVLQSAMQL